MIEDAKIGYWRTNGRYSTAYVSVDDDLAKGEDKYTDEPVTCRWNDLAMRWEETTDDAAV